MPDISYRLIKSRRFGASTTISISPEKGVVVRAPYWVPQLFIDKFVEQKSEWINNHLRSIEAKKISKKYIDGEKHLYFGREYPLSINEAPGGVRSLVELKNDRIVVSLSKNTPKELLTQKTKEALLYWYLERGMEVLTDRVNYYSQRMGVSYAKINLKKVTSIWGSCSPKNHLSFNRKLVMAPREIVDYVVVHELAHIIHRNHSSSFWGVVKIFDSSFKEHRTWLRKNHHLLSI